MAIIGQRKSRATSLRNLRRRWRWAHARANADEHTGNFEFFKCGSSHPKQPPTGEFYYNYADNRERQINLLQWRKYIDITLRIVVQTHVTSLCYAIHRRLI